MLNKTRAIIDQASKQVSNQETAAREFNKRIEKEIEEHQKSMLARREKFNLIRNK